MQKTFRFSVDVFIIDAVACMRNCTGDLTKCPIVEVSDVKKYVLRHSKYFDISVLFPMPSFSEILQKTPLHDVQMYRGKKFNHKWIMSDHEKHCKK